MLWWFAETTCVAMVLACAAGLIGRLPRMGPTARHILWVVVLIKLLTPPVVRSPWPVSLPDAWLAASAKPAHSGGAFHSARSSSGNRTRR